MNNKIRLWTRDEENLLNDLISNNSTLDEMVVKLNRTKSSILSKHRRLKSKPGNNKIDNALNVSNDKISNNMKVDVLTNDISYIQKSFANLLVQHQSTSSILSNSLFSFSSTYKDLLIAIASTINFAYNEFEKLSPSLSIMANSYSDISKMMGSTLSSALSQISTLNSSFSSLPDISSSIGEATHKLSLYIGNNYTKEKFGIDNLVPALSLLESAKDAYSFSSLVNDNNLVLSDTLQTTAQMLVPAYNKLVDTVVADYDNIGTYILPSATKSLLLTGIAASSIEKASPYHNYPQKKIVEQNNEECDEIIALLGRIDPAFVKTYKGALQVFRSNFDDRLRQCLISYRSLWENLISTMAPLHVVDAWIPSEKRAQLTRAYDNKAIPSTKACILYICRDIHNDEFSNYFEAQAKAIVELLRDLSRIHQLEINIPDTTMEFMIMQTNAQLRFLLKIFFGLHVSL